MDKEQEVLALVAGYARFEVDDLERLIDDREVHQATCADIRRMAELLASRSSSDEQRAEVVGWRQVPGYWPNYREPSKLARAIERPLADAHWQDGVLNGYARTKFALSKDTTNAE